MNVLERSLVPYDQNPTKSCQFFAKTKQTKSRKNKTHISRHIRNLKILGKNLRHLNFYVSKFWLNRIRNSCQNMRLHLAIFDRPDTNQRTIY